MNDADASDELGLLTTDGMRARRHPWAVVGVWAWETALALLVAWPVSSLVGRAFGADPRGDAVLWAPGGRELVHLLFREVNGLYALASQAMLVLVAATVLGLVPMAMMLTAIAYARRDGTPAGILACTEQGLRRFPAMALLLVLASVAQGIVAAFGFAAGSVVEAWAHPGLGEARAQQIQALVLLLFLAATAAIGVAHDLSRAAVVRFKVSGGRALILGVRTFRLAPLALGWSWGWRALASLAPIVAAAWAADRVGSRAGGALFVLFVLHQAVILARVALRASWLARALRAVDAALRRVG